MTKILEQLSSIVWGAPTLLLILGTGIYLSVRTGAVQLRLFPQALHTFLEKILPGKTAEGNVSSFQALCTALAATVGTGNIAGVAGAISIGGPGAIFWMWICALLGMGIKFAEAALSVHFRIRSGTEYVGGPMYMIRQGMGRRWHFLAGLYAFFGVIAAFGVGNATQINAVITGIQSTLGAFALPFPPYMRLLTGILLAIVIVLMLSGGARRIGEVSERMVPFAAVLYIIFGLGVLLFRASFLPAAFAAIFRGAFSPQAVTGGVVGSAFCALRTGVSRGIFTNEAGMGTAGIAHAGADVAHPVQQGLMGIMEVFLDTIVICTMTALVILCSGVPIPYGEDTGAALTTQAFASVYGSWIGGVLTLFLCCFALATVLGWGLYGIRCAQYLFGRSAFNVFLVLQAATVIAGAVLKTETVWLLSEIVNGLMAIPNLICLLSLTPVLTMLIREYKMKYGRSSARGGTYEHLNQRKPVRTVSYAKISPSCCGCTGAGKENLSSEYRSA